MNQKTSLESFTAVVSLLSSDQRFYSHYGILFENGIISLSESNRSKNYSTTEFKSELDVNSAVFNFLKEREELLKSIPKSDVAYSIEVDIRCEKKHSVKVVYKIKLK